MDDDTYYRLAHHEDGLVNHRLTWLLAGQPLLFLAYATAATVKQGQTEKLLSEDARQATLFWIPIAGIALSAAVWIGVWGAVLALMVLRNRRDAKIRHAGISDFTTFLGLVPPVAIPPTLIVVWWFLIR